MIWLIITLIAALLWALHKWFFWACAAKGLMYRLAKKGGTVTKESMLVLTESVMKQEMERFLGLKR